jgi:uncharacterized protein YegL
MRRLPIFFLIDVSESMVGTPIRNVNDGIKAIITNLRSNPMALETAYLSLIVFAGKPKTLVPLTELLTFNTPDFPVGGGTALGAAMNFLMDEILKQVQRTTSEQKGDWKSIIFLLTDGSPTDVLTSAVTRWNTQFKNKANLVAISVGNQVDTRMLKQFTEDVLIFDNTDPRHYLEFFKWISASIETKSMNLIMHNKDEFGLSNLDEKILQKGDPETKKSEIHDERFVILLSRCQKTSRPYLSKYKKITSKNFAYEAAYPITEEYFALSSEGYKPTIDTKYLDQIPKCPMCGNPGIVFCTCGSLFCLGQSGINRCPWCGQAGEITMTESLKISGAQG